MGAFQLAVGGLDTCSDLLCLTPLGTALLDEALQKLEDQDPQKGNHLYTTTNVGMWRTTNGGNLWVNVAPHTARWISFSPLDGDVIWTVSNFFGVWRTTNDGKTSAVHFITFPFTDAQAEAFKTASGPVSLGIEHENYRHASVVQDDVLAELAADLD